MLLTIKTTHTPATELGFLLHKHPDHVHTRDFPFGTATVFYPEAGIDACTAAVLLDVDPVGMVRGRSGKGGAADQYVNDRPYVASSLLSVVLARWFGSALAGRCERPHALTTLARAPESVQGDLSNSLTTISSARVVLLGSKPDVRYRILPSGLMTTTDGKPFTP